MARAGTSALAPWRDPEWEIWGLPWISYPRLTIAFEIHSQALIDQSQTWLGKGDWLARFNERCPDTLVYCAPSRLHAFKKAIRYPLDDVARSLPIFYLENSIAYMLALAIHKRVDEIGLWGVHMYAGYEADLAQASVAYLVGLAQGRGIKVTIPPGSPLFMSNFEAGRYGVSAVKRPKIICYAGVVDADNAIPQTENKANG